MSQISLVSEQSKSNVIIIQYFLLIIDKKGAAFSFTEHTDTPLILGKEVNKVYFDHRAHRYFSKPEQKG